MDSAPLLSLLGGLTQGYSQGMGTAYQRNIAMMQMQGMMNYRNMMGTAAMGRMNAYTDGVDGRNQHFGNVDQLGQDKLGTSQLVDLGKGNITAPEYGAMNGPAVPGLNTGAPQGSGAQGSGAQAPPQGLTDPNGATAPGTPPPDGSVISTGSSRITGTPGLGPAAVLKLRMGNGVISRNAATTNYTNDKDNELLPEQVKGLAYKNGVLMPSEVQHNQAMTALAGNQNLDLQHRMPFTVPNVQAQIGMRNAQANLADTTAGLAGPKAKSLIALQGAQGAADSLNANTNGLRAQTSQGELQLGQHRLQQQGQEFNVTAGQHGQDIAIQRLRAGSAASTAHTGLYNNSPAPVPIVNGVATGPQAPLYNKAMGIQPMNPQGPGYHLRPMAPPPPGARAGAMRKLMP